MLCATSPGISLESGMRLYNSRKCVVILNELEDQQTPASAPRGMVSHAVFGKRTTQTSDGRASFGAGPFNEIPIFGTSASAVRPHDRHICLCAAGRAPYAFVVKLRESLGSLKNRPNSFWGGGGFRPTQKQMLLVCVPQTAMCRWESWKRPEDKVRKGELCIPF